MYIAEDVDFFGSLFFSCPCLLKLCLRSVLVRVQVQLPLNVMLCIVEFPIYFCSSECPSLILEQK